MGLTIHWTITNPNKVNIRTALKDLRQYAQRMNLAEVGEVTTLAGDEIAWHLDRKNESDHSWAIIQAGDYVDFVDELGRKCSINVPPKRLSFLTVWPGPGCESASFGLAQYPISVPNSDDYGRPLPRIQVPRGARWSSFCKTQYANEFGTDHFLACHLSVIALLDRLIDIGLAVNVYDEGNYFEKRDPKALAEEVGEWDALVAGMVGLLSDVTRPSGTESDAGSWGIQAPILNRPDFEHLEQAGREQFKDVDAIGRLLAETLKRIKDEGKDE